MNHKGVCRAAPGFAGSANHHFICLYNTHQKHSYQTPGANIKANGPIPANILGNMWAQTWDNIEVSVTIIVIITNFVARTL